MKISSKSIRKIKVWLLSIFSFFTVLFTIILIVFNTQKCTYDNSYVFEFNEFGQNLFFEVTLSDNKTYDVVAVYNGEMVSAVGSYYIIGNELYTKPSTEENYTLLGEISPYEITSSEFNGDTIKLENESAILTRNIFTILLVVSALSLIGVITGIVTLLIIEKVLKTKKNCNVNNFNANNFQAQHFQTKNEIVRTYPDSQIQE
ncbi:MAG: hypothetical protein J6B20_00990 [Clostridia bacterium]|nr:hypothetical protein [Clostridia bacterium]